ERRREKGEGRLQRLLRMVSRQTKSGVQVSGVEDMLVRFGKCCSPLPGERITGFITRGRGVTVHALDCPKVLESDPQRRIDAQGVVAGGLVFCWGRVGLDAATGALVPGGIAAETARALENLAAVLRAAGFCLADVVKTTVYLTDLAEFAAMNEVYGRYLPAPHPARATVQVAKLPAAARVEIEAVAARGRAVGRLS